VPSSRIEEVVMEREGLHQSEQRVAALAIEDDRIQVELTSIHP